MQAYHVMSMAAESAVCGEHERAAELFERAAAAWDRAEDEEMARGCRAMAQRESELEAQ